MAEKRYKLEELKIGMRVTVRELDNILDTYIILIDVVPYTIYDIRGSIAFIGKEPTREIDEIVNKNKDNVFGVYNDSFARMKGFDGDLFHTLVFGDDFKDGLEDDSEDEDNFFKEFEVINTDEMDSYVFDDSIEKNFFDLRSSDTNSGVFRDFLECVPWSEDFIENNNLLIGNNAIPTRLLSKEEKELKMFIYNELLKLGYDINDFDDSTSDEYLSYVSKATKYLMKHKEVPEDIREYLLSHRKG